MPLPEPTRALIVEDDPVVARSIARRLLRDGYVVSLAQTCRAARAAGAGFEVGIFDLDLPDGGGADLADELLRLGAVRTVVFYTGSVDHAQRQRASVLGAVVDKGQNVEAVLAALEPSRSEPPISRLSASARPRSSVSGPRLTRVTPSEDDSVTDGMASRSSRR